MKKIEHIVLLGMALLSFDKTIAQTYTLFDSSLRNQYPSVVYEFLERYLYEIDSIEQSGAPIMQRLFDDKVAFLEGNPTIAASITPQTPFSIITSDNKRCVAFWSDTTGKVLLSVAFPLQYELLLGKPKVQLEKTHNAEVTSYNDYHPRQFATNKLQMADDSCRIVPPIHHYYIESLNTAFYLEKVDSTTYKPVFRNNDKYHSAANLFQGVLDSIDGYQLYVMQNLYGFQQMNYQISLSQWLAYCQAMKFEVYFTIEEERQDGLTALLIVHSNELAFNHMMSLCIPNDFVDDPNSVIKATLHAYIPTQNVKDLYQQYVHKPKKKI